MYISYKRERERDIEREKSLYSAYYNTANSVWLIWRHFRAFFMHKLWPSTVNSSNYTQKGIGKTIGGSWNSVPPYRSHSCFRDSRSTKKKHTSLRRVLSHTVHHSNHIITYKLLIAWLNITLFRGLVICNVFFLFVPCTRFFSFFFLFSFLPRQNRRCVVVSQIGEI